MVVMRMLACDVCGRHEDADGVRHYVVTGDDMSGQADLCHEHAEPLMQFIQLNKPKVRRRSRRSLDVIPVEKIPHKGA